MKIIEQSWKFESVVNGKKINKTIEKAARTCYKSENRIAPKSYEKLLRMIINSSHDSVLEHSTISVRIITDRSTAQQITRHRIGCSYSMESQRYVNYSKQKFGKSISYIIPVWANKYPINCAYTEWAEACKRAEDSYFLLLGEGWTPEQARAVLPNSTKTELVMTCNIRSWRHFFNLRCSNKSHPQLRDLSRDMLYEFNEKVPIMFEDLYEKYFD